MKNEYIEFKPGEKYAAKHAEKSDNPDSFKDCGYLLKDNEIVVDIDTLPKEAIRALIQKFRLDTQIVWTDRGAHVYFEKPKTLTRIVGEKVCALGFKVEIKTPRNSPNGVTIKRNGVMRDIENQDKRMIVPDMFVDKREFDNLLEKSEGSRNNALMSHRGKIDTYDNKRDMIQYINEYIFSEPLSQQEVENILSYKGSGRRSSGENAVAQQVVDDYNLTMWQGMIWMMNTNGGYERADNLSRLVYEYCPDEKTKFVDEVVKQIKMFRCTLIDDEAVLPIKMKNGIISEGKFIAVTTDDFSPYYIDIDYDPKTKAVGIVDSYLKNLAGDDEEYIEYILEMMAYAMITDPEMIRQIHNLFIMQGNGDNGKGTWIEIMRAIYGDKNTTSLTPTQMTEQATLASMIGKLINFGDDLDSQPIGFKELKIMKNITTGDTIQIRPIYKESVQVKLIAKLYNTTNHLIKTLEKSDAWRRRVRWLPMFTKIDKKDHKFISKITSREAISYWLSLIVPAYQRLYERGTMPPCKVVEDFTKKYNVENNPVIRFVNDTGEDDILDHTVTEVKSHFDDYMIENGDEPMKTTKLMKETLFNEFDIDLVVGKRGGKSTRLFRKVTEK